jgi:methylthioribose-1-phosphate isomerase
MLILTEQIRGAPAIASLASLGIASELLTLLSHKPSPSFPVSCLSSPSELLVLLLSRTAYLLTSRPTAVNLLEALLRIEAAATGAVEGGASGEELAEKVVEVAVGVWSEDKERNERIGDNGADWILEKLEREGSIAKGEKIAVLTVSRILHWRDEAEAVAACGSGLQHRLARDVGEFCVFLAGERTPLTLYITGVWHGIGRHHLSPR